MRTSVTEIGPLTLAFYANSVDDSIRSFVRSATCPRAFAGGVRRACARDDLRRRVGAQSCPGRCGGASLPPRHAPTALQGSRPREAETCREARTDALRAGDPLATTSCRPREFTSRRSDTGPRARVRLLGDHDRAVCAWRTGDRADARPVAPRPPRAACDAGWTCVVSASRSRGASSRRRCSGSRVRLDAIALRRRRGRRQRCPCFVACARSAQERQAFEEHVDIPGYGRRDAPRRQIDLNPHREPDVVEEQQRAPRPWLPRCREDLDDRRCVEVRRMPDRRHQHVVRASTRRVPARSRSRCSIAGVFRERTSSGRRIRLACRPRATEIATRAPCHARDTPEAEPEAAEGDRVLGSRRSAAPSTASARVPSPRRLGCRGWYRRWAGSSRAPPRGSGFASTGGGGDPSGAPARRASNVTIRAFELHSEPDAAWASLARRSSCEHARDHAGTIT